MTVTDLVFIDAAGYHFSDYPSFLAYVQQSYRDIYGADVNLDSDTQDGQFLAIHAQNLYDMASLGAAIYNSFSPVTAQGLGLARLVKINGLKKGVPTNSTVDLTIVGQAFSVISNGIATDTLQQKWLLPATVTIPTGGSIVVTATAENQGAVAAATGTVTTIFTPTLGWQTVTNAGPATPGNPVESDAALRSRQADSTADPSLTVVAGTVGGLRNLTGVTKVRSYENVTGTTDVNGLPNHSVCFVVQGGDAQAIANEIALHKTPGTVTYGNTSESVVDPNGMGLTINFQRPTVATIQVTVTIVHNASWSSDYIPMIQKAVADQINGLQIGTTVYYTALFLPAYLTGTVAAGSFSIANITIGKNGGAQSAANIALAFSEVAVTVAASDVTVVVT